MTLMERRYENIGHVINLRKSTDAVAETLDLLGMGPICYCNITSTTLPAISSTRTTTKGYSTTRSSEATTTEISQSTTHEITDTTHGRTTSGSTLPTECGVKTDLVFLIDNSGSI